MKGVTIMSKTECGRCKYAECLPEVEEPKWIPPEQKPWWRFPDVANDALKRQAYFYDLWHYQRSRTHVTCTRFPRWEEVPLKHYCGEFTE
jgi:hypothetical protein